MVVKKERAHPALDAHDDRSGAPSLRSAGDSNVTASGLQASPNVTSSLLSMGNSSTARLRPALSAPLAPPPVLSGAVSPSVAAIGFWVSGGTAAYVKYGPHGKELDSTLKMVLTVGSVAGLLITSVMLYLIFTKDRALLRCLKQRNDFVAGGMAGLIFCLLFSSLPREMSMTVQIPESLGVMINLVPESYPVEMLSGLLVSLSRLGMMLGTLLTYPLTSGRWHQPRLKWAVVGWRGRSYCSAGCLRFGLLRLEDAYGVPWQGSDGTPSDAPRLPVLCRHRARHLECDRNNDDLSRDAAEQ